MSSTVISRQHFTLLVNGRKYSVEAEPDTPLLWVIREMLGLTGTRYGCGIAQCGACTLHIDGVAERACVTPVSVVEGKAIVTIEGLSENELHPLQQAWIDLDVPQCGYCQSGQIMAASALLTANPSPDDDEIREAMDGNICRCGAYRRIHAAVRKVISESDTSS